MSADASKPSLLPSHRTQAVTQAMTQGHQGSEELGRNMCAKGISDKNIFISYKLNNNQ